MRVEDTNLADCKILIPEVFADERGFFLETYNKTKFDQLFGNITFKQDNHSRSDYAVLRGLHYQKKNPQGKLVRVVSGEVFDVAVDIRPDSNTFGKWTSVILSAENKKQFWIPPGFAHGFIVLSDYCDFEYKCTEYYDPSDEGSIIWNDTEIQIDWPISKPKVSRKDQSAKKLSEIYE